jgi:hypothetical protein
MCLFIFARAPTPSRIEAMNRAMCVWTFSLLFGGGLLVEAVQDRPALKAVFKDAFVMGTSVNNAIVSGNDGATRSTG